MYLSRTVDTSARHLAALHGDFLLSENPLADEDDYRLEVLIALRKIERLDKDEYTEEERAEAQDVFETRRQEELEAQAQVSTRKRAIAQNVFETRRQIMEAQAQVSARKWSTTTQNASRQGTGKGTRAGGVQREVYRPQRIRGSVYTRNFTSFCTVYSRLRPVADRSTHRFLN